MISNLQTSLVVSQCRNPAGVAALLSMAPVRHWTTVLSATACLLFLSACARTNVEHRTTDTRRMPKPDTIVVHDFSVSPDQVALDHNMGLRLQEMMGSQTDASERLRIAQEISKIVTQQLVKDLAKMGLNVVAAPAAGAPGTRILDIEGQFFSIDQGNQRQRMIIGFGMGASEVRVMVQAFETTGEGRELVDDFFVTTQSSRRPGLGPMGGAGAVAGNAAASLALSSTSMLVGARAQTVQADAQNLADRVSAELEKYFVQQGWLPAGK